jgi:hypothetical protein
MVLDLLIGNFKTHRFDVELLCRLQIVAVEFNPGESRLDLGHKILSGFEYSAAAASAKPYRKVLAITFGVDDRADELKNGVGAVKLLDKMDLADQLIPAILEVAPAGTMQPN